LSHASSGRRLFEWLTAAGWDEADFRSRHYMTAVTKCFPGKSASGRGDRVPSKEEQALCRRFLEQEVHFVAPRLIIPVGTLAIRLFYPSSAKLRQVIGSGAFFSDDNLDGLADPFDTAEAELRTELNVAESRNGRWIVPLPHPSGASSWPNLAGNRALIDRAINLLGQLRRQWRL